MAVVSARIARQRAGRSTGGGTAALANSRIPAWPPGGRGADRAQAVSRPGLDAPDAPLATLAQGRAVRVLVEVWCRRRRIIRRVPEDVHGLEPGAQARERGAEHMFARLRRGSDGRAEKRPGSCKISCRRAQESFSESTGVGSGISPASSKGTIAVPMAKNSIT